LVHFNYFRLNKNYVKEIDIYYDETYLVDGLDYDALITHNRKPTRGKMTYTHLSFSSSRVELRSKTTASIEKFKNLIKCESGI